MTWEVGASWAGVLVAIIVGFFTFYRSGTAKREAAEATQRSREALAASQSMATSLDKIADALSRATTAPPPGLMHLRGGATETRAGAEADRREAGDARRHAAEAAVPAWNVEYRTGQRYALRNVGGGSATGVTIDAGSAVSRNLPEGDGVSLGAGQAHEFILAGTWQSPIPTDLLVNCTELGPVHVPLPPAA